ncbi:hypothetical protein C6N75_28160 [Streptomyces solincola]|uniref:Uncharacterized protein n=1 Tax=Streptomyces solincola TaxID=2100817 RepID=A0A2S9PNE3_9ACTN|nr:hypothetical protein C6N75_28160 [Streptomyces solincola]
MPGLYFTGYTNPISGMLRELARDGERIAARIVRREAKESVRRDRRAAKAAGRGRRAAPRRGRDAR